MEVYFFIFLGFLTIFPRSKDARFLFWARVLFNAFFILSEKIVKFWNQWSFGRLVVFYLRNALVFSWLNYTEKTEELKINTKIANKNKPSTLHSSMMNPSRNLKFLLRLFQPHPYKEVRPKTSILKAFSFGHVCTVSVT